LSDPSRHLGDLKKENTNLADSVNVDVGGPSIKPMREPSEEPPSIFGVRTAAYDFLFSCVAHYIVQLMLLK
jgi:hypothetical protein